MKKRNAAHDAEDKLFTRASPKAKALLKKSRELKRSEARKAWWTERNS